MKPTIIHVRPCVLTAMLRPLAVPKPRPSPRPTWLEPRYDVLGDAVELHHGTRNVARSESRAASGPGRDSLFVRSPFAPTMRPLALVPRVA